MPWPSWTIRGSAGEEAESFIGIHHGWRSAYGHDTGPRPDANVTAMGRLGSWRDYKRLRL